MKFYLSTDTIWQAIEADCLQAKHSIIMEQYIVNNDSKGEEVLSILTQVVKRGVSVRLMLDYIGSHSLQSSKILATFREAGGEVFFDRPLWWIQVLLPHTWFPRNHCKVTVIDDDIAYVGGACFAAYMSQWRETQIRLTGHMARVIQSNSSQHWNHPWNDSESEHTPNNSQDSIQYIVHNPLTGRYPLPRILLQQIRSARHNIAIVSPYFFPPRWLRRALYRAQKQGVQVTLLVSEKTDVDVAFILTRALLSRWLRKRFQVWFYQPVILHAKYAIIDDDWATVGSNNFDYLSMRFNREANLVIRDPHIISILKQHLETDKQHSRLASLRDWEQLNFREKCVGRITKWFYNLLWL